MQADSKETTVLLVDDEEDIRDVLSLSLQDLGYTVHTADNGQAALQQFESVRPRIVLTDIKMPGMDGIELLQQVKRRDPEAEVVMITGHGDMDLAIRSLKNDATDFITKPINVEALEIALKRVHDKIVMKRQLKDYTASLEALIKEKIQLQDHLSSLGLMIGSISHGLKGLLTGLDGGMYLVESGFTKENQAQIKEGWETVKIMVERIRKMVLDILFYAKERHLNWERVDAHSFCAEIARVVAPKVTGKGIEFVPELDESIGEIEIDAGYLHSAIINLIENAVDACMKDTDKDDHKVVFSARKSKGNILFEVFDNGVGMDSETVEKLFTPFFSSKGRKGTGLGLFISNKIIEQHGGTITVKSTPGQGSLFTIHIPLSQPQSLNSAKAKGGSADAKIRKNA